MTIRTVKDADSIHKLVGLYAALQSARVSSGYFVEDRVADVLSTLYTGTLVKRFKIKSPNSDRKTKQFDVAIRNGNSLDVFEIKTYAGDSFTYSEDTVFKSIYTDLEVLKSANPGVDVKLYYVFSDIDSEFAIRMKKEKVVGVISFADIGLNANELIIEGMMLKFNKNLADLSISDNLKKAITDEFSA
jgi:hypothetical protein